MLYKSAQAPPTIPLDVLVIVRLLIATLHVGMIGFQDGGYTQWVYLQRDYLCRAKISHDSLTSS